MRHLETRDALTDSNVLTFGYTGTATVGFVYDDDGLLTDAGALHIVRDPDNGLLLDTILGNVTTGQSYSTFGELTAFAANGGALYAQAFPVRDKLGRIVQETESVLGGPATTTTYGYDLAGRLETVAVDDGTTVTTRTYGYDGNGNRTSLTENGVLVATGVPDAQDRLLSYGTNTYSYTDAGDLLTKTDSTLPAGQQTTTYSYDALGKSDRVFGRTRTAVAARRPASAPHSTRHRAAARPPPAAPRRRSPSSESS